jgi:hypothetical protein
VKRFPIRAALAALSVLALCTVSAIASAAPPRAQLRQFVCQRALDPVAREISVLAVMRPVNGTQKLAIRFDLQEKTKPSGRFRSVRAPGLNSWITPNDPTLGRQSGDTWRLTHPVFNLAGPATYRFRVTFRWSGAHGHVLQTAVRLSPTCFQQELRANLLVRKIIVSRIRFDPSHERYVAVIRNAGASGAGPFQVLFAPGGGAPSVTRTVKHLGAHKEVQLTFVGPACTASTAPTVTADPTAQVDDLNRADNSLKAGCVGPAGD